MKISKQFTIAALAFVTLATAGCSDQYVKTETGELVQKFEWDYKTAYTYSDGGIVIPQPLTNTVRLIYIQENTEYLVDYAENRFCRGQFIRSNSSRIMECSDFSEVKSAKNKERIEKLDDYFKVTRAVRP